MGKVKSFAMLDYMTVKPYLRVRNIGLFAIWIGIMSVATGDTMMGVGIGLMMCVMLTGYPFQIGEKSNIDALYATLSIDKGTVVRGRYLFVLAFDVVAVAGSFIVGLAGSFIMAQFNRELFVYGDWWAFLPLAATFLFIQAVQLALYFKFGYTKARLLGIIPFLLLGAIYGVIAASGAGNFTANRMLGFFMELAENTVLFVSAITAAIAAVVFISYCLSLRFYKKREF